MGKAIEITLNGKTVEDSDILAFTVERDMGQPDMAAIVLSNQQANWSTQVGVTDSVEIKVGDNLTSIYKGEVTGLEAHYKGNEKSRLTIRAMNRMHRLLRQRKSVTFADKNDKQILQQVCGDAGLSLEYSGPEITYKHVYQHNQTNMEFLRMRAARMGCHVWCVDTKLYVKEPKLDQGPAVTLDIGDVGAAAIREFRPRISSSAVLKKVTVKGWNPETKELIQGDYSAQNSSLGSQNAVAGSRDHGKEESFTVDHPIWSVEEAKAIAKARVVDSALAFMTGECETLGNPALDLGTVVKIKASAESNSSNDPFNGKYYVMGLTHRYTETKTKDGGYVSILRLARDAQKE